MSVMFTEVLDELEKFVWWLSGTKHSDDVPLLDEEEIAGELFLELLKGYQYYESKISNKQEMLAALRRTLDNRVSELFYKYTVTHRKAGIGNYNLDQLEGDFQEGHEQPTILNIDWELSATLIATPASPEILAESNERVQETRARLSVVALLIFDAIMTEDNPLMYQQVVLSGRRATATGRKTVSLKPWHVSEALALDTKTVLKAMEEIRRVYSDVCKEYV